MLLSPPCPRSSSPSLFFLAHILLLLIYFIYFLFLPSFFLKEEPRHLCTAFSGFDFSSEIYKMNRYAFHHNSFAACEEMRGNAAACRSVEMKETIICPKPRRLGLIQTTTLYEPSYPRPLRWQASHHHQEAFDSKAGSELLDIILAKQGSCATDQPVPQVTSSPPFFSGSPPSRVSNPLTQDARFGDEKYTPISPQAIPTPTGLAPSPSSTRKGAGGCVRASFGNNPARRVEGFDCLDRDRRNCSIPALA